MAYMDFVPGINRDYVRELRASCGLATGPSFVEDDAKDIFERICEGMEAYFAFLPDGVELDVARLLGGNDWLYDRGPEICGEASVVWEFADWVEHAQEYLDSHGTECYGIDAERLATTMLANTNLRRMCEDQTEVGWRYVHFSVERPAVQRRIAETSRHNLAIDVQEALQGTYEARDAYDPALDPDGLGPVEYFVRETELMLESPEGRDTLVDALYKAETTTETHWMGEHAKLICAIKALPVDQARERADDGSQEVAR